MYLHDVQKHYQHGHLLQSIEESLSKLGKDINSVTIEDLAPVDEFHIGGREATAHLIKQLDFHTNDNILDIGCGLGGSSRFVAKTYKSKLSGIDLSQEYIETGNTLCSWLNLDKDIKLIQGSALTMPFEDESFDGAFMIHVGMNIQDKAQLFKEVARVLKKGASFGIYDVMKVNNHKLTYPVPWATDEHTSIVSTQEEYISALSEAGLSFIAKEDRGDFALSFFSNLKKKVEKLGKMPPLGLHTLMQKTTYQKIKNMIENISKGYVSPIEIISKKN